MKQLIVLSRVIDEVDGDSFRTLEGRITFQKRVYLVQAAGIQLGYAFSWNQYGPYSSELAQDGTALEASREEIRQIADSLTVRESAEEILRAVRELTEPPPAVGVAKAAWLELLSSVHFLLAQHALQGLPAGEEDRWSEIAARLVKLKPYFKPDHVLEALRALEARSLLPEMATNSAA